MPKVSRGGQNQVRQTKSQGSGGGQVSGGGQSQAQQNAPTPQQVAQGQVAPSNQVTTYSDFMNMTDDEKADAITQAIQEDTPDFLENTSLQRLAYNMGLSLKPTVVADSALNAMNGVEMFRTVNSTYDRRNDVGYSAKEITDQIAKGDFTMYNSGGGMAYGAGLYFATSSGHSSLYAQHSDGKRSMQIRVKIPKNRIVTRSKASAAVQKEMAARTSLGKALRACDSASRESIWALANGYSAINNDGSYYTIVNRGGIMMSDSVKGVTSRGSDLW